MKKYTRIHYDEIHSTNSLVKETFNELDDHTLVTTDYQTKGRGRRTNTWISDKGQDFLGTFYKISNEDYSFRYLLEASYALVKTLKHFEIDASIKPPNDVYVLDKKIAGILIEVIHEDTLHVVSGIGLNIMSDSDATKTSMHNVLNKPIDRIETTNVLKKAYEEAETQTESYLFKVYHSHVNFDKIYVDEMGELRPLQDISESFECVVFGAKKPCDSLRFVYKP